jgi:hypothetical protein
MSLVAEYLSRDWDMLVGREHGPLSFRLVLQPAVAGALAVRAGIGDARAGRPAFGWTFVTRSDQRKALAAEEWKDISRLFLVAGVIDVIYQLMVYFRVYPLQAIEVAVILAVPSYFLMRGLSNRVARVFLQDGK